MCTTASNETSIMKEEPVYRVSSQSRAGRGFGGGGAVTATRRDAARQDTARCSVCGLKNHTGDKCRYKNYKCQKCGVKGHLKKVCGNGKRSCIYHVDADSECDKSEVQDASCQECENFNIRYVADKPILINVYLGNEYLSMELDSGSGRCVISDKLYQEKFSNHKLHKCNIKMCLYNGHKISPSGFFTIQATFNKVTKIIKIFVIKNGGPPLLGRDFMSAFNLVIASNLNSISYDLDVNTLLEKFPDLWSDDLGSFNKFKILLQIRENSVPKYFKPRPVPFALKRKIEEELDRLVNAGILVPINHSRYATPIVPVLKSDGQVKIAGDFSVTLNKDLIVEKYPMPRIEEVFAQIGGGEHYSKIDLKNAYNQFVLDESCQDLTAINTHKGLFKYTRLVYGLANAPAIFQKSMETLLSGIEGVSIWLDDICVTGPNRVSHMERLGEVLRRLNEAGLRLHKDKCVFFKESVTYLGYVISKEGLKTCPDKVRAIMDAPEPTNVTEVKRFLGVVNYYRNFIPNASSVLHPLHELLRKNAPWKWGESQKRSVEAVRRELASERVLAHFEPEAQLVLAVDAGPAGLGAVLSQRGDDGRERPLAFASRSLTVSERNYSQIQKEATAIIFGVKHFHQYLYGRSDPFILKTDHRPLVSIFNKNTGIPITTALRLQRYALLLSAYNYVVQYVSSEDNPVADYFSRAPIKSSEGNDVAPDQEVDRYYAIKFLDEVSPAITIRDIAQAVEQDTELTTVRKYMQHGWPRKIKCKSILPYFLCKTDLQDESGCLFRGHKVIIPTALREKLLTELHDSHLGITKTKSAARSRIWWPGIDGDIERWVGACATCASLRAAPPREPPAPWPKAAAPWQRVHIDYLSIGQRVYLVIVDSFSKWLECLYMHNGTSTRALISKLKCIFSIFGIPNVLVSDNDVKINSDEFRTFCTSNGIKYMTSPIYHPPSNGQAENSVRTCKKMLKCILQGDIPSHKIDETLLGYLFNYRNTVHCTTGETPAKLMFGRHLRSRLDLILPSGMTHSIEEVPVKRHFELGDVVWTRWYNARKETWQLGTIKEKVGNRMYRIILNDPHVSCIRHVDQIIKYTGSMILSEESSDRASPIEQPVPPIAEHRPNGPLEQGRSIVVRDPVCVLLGDNGGTDLGGCEDSECVRGSGTGVSEGTQPAPPPDAAATAQPTLPTPSEQSHSDARNDVSPSPSHALSRQLRPKKRGLMLELEGGYWNYAIKRHNPIMYHVWAHLIRLQEYFGPTYMVTTVSCWIWKVAIGTP
ncbi:hypothetical protein ABMA27_013312 [Loxostege sticticalis]|uniref:RNA-directed DNA polymerase n=1 Tax=Loxostege sticticalis TaxID=481309 RepID=A0ABR3IEV2_LOXSC